MPSVGQYFRRRNTAAALKTHAAWQSGFDLTYDKLILDPVLRSYFGPDGYFNAGYWDADTRDPSQASRILADRLGRHHPARMPNAAARRRSCHQFLVRAA